MTAQINDTCFHLKTNFAVAGISGSGLFDPESLGTSPVPMSTACRRGFVAHYAILESELFLTSLDIGLPQGEHPELFGVLPTRDRSSGSIYQGFQAPVPFTGGLLLADGFIHKLYVHMGFHPAWKYERVREVTFDAGRVLEDHDCSAQMAHLRTKFIRDMNRASRKDRERGDIAAWIKRCFSRDC